MIQYDSKVIYVFAERLYSRANSLMLTYTIIGGLVGAAVGTVLNKGLGTILGAVVVGGLAFVIAQERAFQLKLQAQVALCQAQVEENTRPRRVP